VDADVFNSSSTNTDQVLTDEELESLLDRRPEVFTQQSSGSKWSVIEEARDESNDALANMNQ